MSFSNNVARRELPAKPNRAKESFGPLNFDKEPRSFNDTSCSVTITPEQQMLVVVELPPLSAKIEPRATCSVSTKHARSLG